MNKILNSTKKILQNYDYLHLYTITQLIKSEWVFEDDIKSPEDFLNSAILDDIDKNWINSVFIKVWLEQYALRKYSEEENLLSFLKCRLSTFTFWELNHHDINYSIHLFWQDLFTENEKLLNMLENLKNTWKIASFTSISSKQVIVWF